MKYKGVGIFSKRIMGVGALLVPCLTNALFLGDRVVGSVFANAIEGEDDAEIRSNAVHLDGVTPSFIEFENSILNEVSTVQILHSADNVAWSTTDFAIDAISNIFSIDLINGIFYTGTIPQYYSSIELQYSTGEVVAKILNASNSAQDDNVANTYELGLSFPNSHVEDNSFFNDNLQIAD